MAYEKLDETRAIEYVRKLGIFPDDAKLTAKEVGDGNLNLVFKIKDENTGKSVVIKQALPYVRVVGEGWPMTLDRARIEAEALKIQNKLAPGLVPKLYHMDPEMALMVMEDLSHLEVMRRGMIRMKKYPKFPDHISTFMANTLFYTSDFYLDSAEKKELVKKFINPQLCKITEDLIFTEPYYDAERNNVNPELRPYLETVFWKRKALWNEATKLKFKFMTEAQSLVHGDLHTGSIFAGPEETKVFDTEFSYVGPAAFDPGLLLGNILINYVSWDGKRDKYTSEQIADYREYILDMINDTFTQFEEKFTANWEKDAREISAKVPGYMDYYLRTFFVDMVGYAATVMIRRIHGLAHNIDVDEIEDLKVRRDVQIEVLELAEEIMFNRAHFDNIKDLTRFVKKELF